MEAKELRKRGMSYREISSYLDIAKSTAKLWCKDVELNQEQRKILYKKQIELMARGPNSSRARRNREIEKILSSAEKELKLPIDSETYRLLGAMIYWGEGDKTQHFGIANSDPFLIKFMIKWLEDILGIMPNRIKAYLNIHSQQNDIEIKKFWSELTEIPIQNFGKTFIKPTNKNFKKNNLYYGTIRIIISKGTDLRYRVMGWISALLASQNLEVEKIQNKWHKLREEYSRP